MIYDELKNLSHYKGIAKNLDTAIDFLKKTDLFSLTDGKHEIDGENVYINVANIQTKPQSENKFEIHRRYVDIHIDLNGTEKIPFAFPSALTADTDFNEQQDCMLLSGSTQGECILGTGKFMICFPMEGHMPGTALNDTPQNVKKCIVKVAL